MKRNSTTAAGPEFKKKNSEGRSYKTADGPRTSDGGGDRENEKVAKHAHKGLRPGTSTTDKQSPAKQRSRKVAVYKIPEFTDKVDEWCAGKRKSYT